MAEGQVELETPGVLLDRYGSEAKEALKALLLPESEGGGLKAFATKLVALTELGIEAKQKGAFSTPEELTEAIDGALFKFTGADTKGGQLPKIEAKLVAR